MGNSWRLDIRRAGLAAAMALAAEASAYDWCPTQAVNYVTCSYCTVKLTCTVQGQIKITGTGVQLDGNYNWVAFNSGDAIEISGYQSHLTRLGIYAPGSNGVRYTTPPNSSASHTASEVSIYYTGNNGVLYEAGAGPVGAWIQYMESSVNYSGEHGILSRQRNGATNVYDSYLDYNEGDGFFGSDQGYQTHARNSYSENGRNGVTNWLSTNGGKYSESVFNTNGSSGIYIYGVVGPTRLELYNNSGFDNGPSWLGDCDGTNTNHLLVGGNTWGYNDGCITKP